MSSVTNEDFQILVNHFSFQFPLNYRDYLPLFTNITTYHLIEQHL